MPLDPQVEAVLAQMDAAGQPPLHTRTVADAREMARLLAALDAPLEPVEAIEDGSVPGPNGPIPVRVYRAEGAPSPPPVTMWFHAGGGVIGDLDTADSCCRRLANRSKAVVVSVDYRRGPEHRFPAAVDDCWTVTRWVATHSAELGVDEKRMAVGGDSMGGGFAAVVAQRAARAGGPELRHQLLVYPMLDASLSLPSVTEFADGYVLTKDLCAWFYDHYLGPGVDRADPNASPLHAPSLDGCAPATVVVAEFDPVRDEAIAYAKRLSAAGVPVELHEFDGMIHVFFAMAGVIDRAREAMDIAAAALRVALA